LEATEVIMVWY